MKIGNEWQTDSFTKLSKNKSEHSHNQRLDSSPKTPKMQSNLKTQPSHTPLLKTSYKPFNHLLKKLKNSLNNMKFSFTKSNNIYLQPIRIE